MIPVSEMLEPAVWTDWADAYRVCMMIRSNTLIAVVVPAYETQGYSIISVPREKISHAYKYKTVLTRGVVAALCARHDLPADDPKNKRFYGPRFEAYPFFADGLPKERAPEFKPLELD